MKLIDSLEHRHDPHLYLQLGALVASTGDATFAEQMFQLIDDQVPIHRLDLSEWTLDSDQASIRQVKVLGSAGLPEATPAQAQLRHPLLQSIMRMEDPLLIQINAPVHQCNLVSRSGDRRWVICCHRQRSERMFSLAELSLLKRLSDTLLPLVEHHAQLFLQAAQRRPGSLQADEAGSLRQVFTERLEQEAIRLSSREQEVCIGLLTGGTVPQMAQRLNVKNSSIETYLKRATAKLGVSGRHGLARWMAGT
ncbi:helix-turn-helix transcriptional regulator [Pseudomonas putida]|nr:helix-turn-helix transcriptional regulator [Pseudomonas putida]